MQKIDINAALQAHPEFLNEKIDDRDKAVYAKGWNDCNREYYNAIAELPVASIDCTDLSTRLRRAFEADELVNQRLLLDAADTIEELLKEVQSRENDCINLTGECSTYYAQIPKWHPVSEKPTRSNPKYAREDFLVHLESGKVMSLTYEFDNSDRCGAGFEPLFPVGWRKTGSPVTHWANMPKFKLPMEESE